MKSKKMLGLALTLLVSCFVVSSSAQCLTGNDNPPMMNPKTNSMMKEARLSFALDALRKAALIEGPQSNLFFSPHSLHQAVLIAYFGARGTTETSLKKALHIPVELSKVDVQRSYGLEKSLQESMNDTSSSYEYKSANHLWISSAKKVRECMLSLFNSELDQMDFRADPNAARQQINDWVSNMTKAQIKDLIPQGGIDETTDLVLANAVYFKGLWQSRFDKANSKRDIFYGAKNSLVMYMRQKRTFNHVVSEELGAHVLELPYKGDDISMYVFLPPFAMARSMNSAAGFAGANATVDRDGIHQLMERITGTERGMQEFRELLDNGMPPREVEVSLPRFKVEQELQVGSLLHALGAGEIMSDQADLRGFVADGEKSLRLGDAVHRAKVDVDEEGTTAAAATALFSFRSSRPAEPAVFNANHPFLYFLYNKSTQAILFSGIYRSPATPSEPTAAPHPAA